MPEERRDRILWLMRFGYKGGQFRAILVIPKFNYSLEKDSLFIYLFVIFSLNELRSLYCCKNNLNFAKYIQFNKFIHFFSVTITFSTIR